MGFAQHTHDTRTQSGNSSNLTFFRFKVNAECKSPESAVNFNLGSSQQPRMQEVSGYFEVVHFLNEFNKTPIIRYHDTNKDHQILCAETFPEFKGNCPACAEWERIKPNFEGVDAEIRNAQAPVRWQRSKLMIPVYVPRRAFDKHIHKGKTQILPIYWLEICADSYPEGSDQSFLRLRNCNDNQYPIHQTPYVVLQKPKTGKYDKVQWYFLPIGYDPNQYGVQQNLHPILNYIDPQTCQKVWSPEYHDMLELLPLLGFKQYYDVTTGQTFEYGGYYEQALNMYNAVKKAWPPASIRLATPTTPVANFGAPVQPAYKG